MEHALFRCQNCDALVPKKNLLYGAHLGHSLKLADKGSLLEWIRVQFWKLTGRL